jgi:hypothetical protein
MEIKERLSGQGPDRGYGTMDQRNTRGNSVAETLKLLDKSVNFGGMNYKHGNELHDR